MITNGNLGMKNTWFSIKAKADDDKSAKISIHDEIGDFGVSANQFMAELEDLGEDIENIHLSVHSPGGSVLDGWAIYNRLKEHPAKVSAKVEGFAGSMASVILLAADEREMPENSWQMIHYPHAGVHGTAQDMSDFAESLDKIEKGIVSAYSKRTGLSEDDVRGMLKKETFMDAAESVAKGFADSVTNSFKAAACASEWRDKLPKNLPKGLAIDGKAKAKPEPKKPASQPESKIQPTKEMETTQEPKAKVEAPAVNLKDIRDQERGRIAEINAIGQRFKVDEKAINDAVDKETSVQAFRAEVMDGFDPSAFNLTNVEGSGHSAKIDDPEVNKFSVMKAIREMSEKGKVSGLEAECQQELEKRFVAATGNAPAGLLLPANVTHGNSQGPGSIRAAQTAGTTTGGGYTVATETRGIIEYLEDYMLLPELGVTFLRDLTGNVEFPRNTASYTVADDAETDAISYTDAVFGQISLSPKRVGGGTKVSKQLMIQSSTDIEQWVRRRLGQDMAKKMDRNGIIGAGGDAPTGVLSASGTTAYTFQVGNSLHKNTLDMWKDLRDNNAASATACWLSEPGITVDWMDTPKVASTDSKFVADGNPRDGLSVLNYAFKDHTDVTANKVVFGDFSYCMAAFWGGIDLVVDPYSSKDQGLVEVFANAFADIDLEQPSAFVIGDNGTTHA